jgi:hypothetical protein
MISTAGGRLRRLVAFATVSLSLASGAAAKGEEPEETSQEEADALAPPPKPKAKPEATPAAAEPTGQAPAPEASASAIEHMGPETFPGRLRGIEGGSLWLEPDFQGLQWPQNTRSGLGVSGTFWVDSGYEKITRGTPQQPNSSLLLQQGRGVLRLTPAYVSGRFFGQAQAELVGNLCQAVTTICLTTGTFSTDDLWIRFGMWNAWDFKFGRFEGWEVYHLGMGMEQYTLERLGAGMFGVDPFTTPKLEAPTFYGVNFIQYRPSDGQAVGHLAFHAYPTEFLRFELLAKLGTDNYRSDNATGDTPWNYYGGRPAVIFDIGWFKLRIAGEYQKRTATTQTLDPGAGQKKDPVPARMQKGVGGSVQFVLAPILEFGVNAALGKQDETDAFARPVLENSFTNKSVGGFANFRVTTNSLIGLGANWTAQTDQFLAPASTANNFTSQLQGFGAFQYRPVGHLYIKVVLAGAQADFLPSDLMVTQWHNRMISGRIRLLYIY